MCAYAAGTRRQRRGSKKTSASCIIVAVPALTVVALAAVVWADVGAAPAAPATSAQPAATAAPQRPKLGRLEQESVDDAMSGLGLASDPAPEGKTIGRIHVSNQDVFSRRDWRLQFLNYFHWTTRPEILQRELLMKPGQPYDETLIHETIRNLQDAPSLTVAGRVVASPELSSVVAIVPVKSEKPGEVDLLAVTRDVWSLRLNTVFEVQQDSLVLLNTSLSENNLFGWRKFLTARFYMDQGQMLIGPTYLDPNIKGTRLNLYASASLAYARATGDYEGNSQSFAFGYPLYSLASRWGSNLSVVHWDAPARGFRGNSLALQDLAATPAVVEQIPWMYHRRIATVDAYVTRSFGGTLIRRVTAGYRVDARQSRVPADFAFDATTAQQFLNEWAPISETRSEPYLGFQMFTPRYEIYRDLNTFDLRENRQLGPSLSALVGYGLPAFGADFPALVLSGSVSWAFGPAGWYGSIKITGQTRRRYGSYIDQGATVGAYLATPLVLRVARLVMSAQIEGVRASTERLRYVLGGDNGLRGYIINEFQGQVRTLGHAEIRTAPLALFSQRFGALSFYDVGHAAPSLASIVLHHNLGFGLRWLIPQLNSSVIRFDWAFALQNTMYSRAGWPGRFMAGFEQVF
jgi:hypothetical protein